LVFEKGKILIYYNFILKYFRLREELVLLKPFKLMYLELGTKMLKCQTMFHKTQVSAIKELKL